MKLSLLGPVALHGDDGVSITPSPLKLRELLALLLINANRVVVAEHLIAQLWNSAPPRTAKTALQVYVSKLRGHLAHHYGERGEPGAFPRLVTEPSGYALLVAEGDLDLSRFEALRSRARAAERAGDLECASALFGQALEVWRGPALADVRALAELNTEAERLDEARMRVQEQHVATDLLLDRHWDAVPRLTELTKQHPLRESLHEHLILAQYRCGRTAESLETYTKIRGDLVRQIGMEPGVRLQSLHRAILNRDPVLDTGLLLAS